MFLTTPARCSPACVTVFAPAQLVPGWQGIGSIWSSTQRMASPRDCYALVTDVDVLPMLSAGALMKHKSRCKCWDPNNAPSTREPSVWTDVLSSSAKESNFALLKRKIMVGLSGLDTVLVTQEGFILACIDPLLFLNAYSFATQNSLGELVDVKKHFMWAQSRLLLSFSKKTQFHLVFCSWLFPWRLNAKYYQSEL